MALANIKITNADWWTAADALRAYSPPDGPLATLIEAAIPARGVDSTVLTEIMGLADASQASIFLRLPVTPAPIFNAKVVASAIGAQVRAQGG